MLSTPTKGVSETNEGVTEKTERPEVAEPPAPASKLVLFFEFGLWGLAALTFVYLLWLTWSQGAAFGAVRTGYVVMSVLCLLCCFLTPLLIPWTTRIPYRLLSGLGFLAFGVDQVTKWVAVCFLKNRPSIPIIDNIFSFTYVQNPGAAFGLLRGQTTLFIVMAIFTVGIIMVYFKLTGPDERLVQVALVFILAGALGNLVDRVFLGYVVDFLDLHYYAYKWPVFNIADTTIDIGVGLIIIDVIRDILFGEIEEEGEGEAKVGA